MAEEATLLVADEVIMAIVADGAAEASLAGTAAAVGTSATFFESLGTIIDVTVTRLAGFMASGFQSGLVAAETDVALETAEEVAEGEVLEGVAEEDVPSLKEIWINGIKKGIRPSLFFDKPMGSVASYMRVSFMYQMARSAFMLPAQDVCVSTGHCAMAKFINDHLPVKLEDPIIQNAPLLGANDLAQSVVGLWFFIHPELKVMATVWLITGIADLLAAAPQMFQTQFYKDSHRAQSPSVWSFGPAKIDSATGIVQNMVFPGDIYSVDEEKKLRPATRWPTSTSQRLVFMSIIEATEIATVSVEGHSFKFDTRVTAVATVTNQAGTHVWTDAIVVDSAFVDVTGRIQVRLALGPTAANEDFGTHPMLAVHGSVALTVDGESSYAHVPIFGTAKLKIQGV